ncbi:MAG: DUF4350 domain-containing protein, partial [Candidatus Thermoplasmatota archaeon]|nr:DUF4350 domain-containing protein [Candidatus Thermoplasmatota archaeon]
MRSRIGRGYASIAVMAVAIALLAVSMTAPAISTTEDFSIFNSGWNGTSGLAVMTYRTGKFVPTFQVESTGTDITVAQRALTTVAPDPRTSALIIIGPAKDFTDAEGTLVGDFVREGGRLVLADDFGTGNSLLTKMGAGSRFSNHLVMDLSFEKQPEFSVVFDIRPDPLTTNVSTLLFNYASSITVDSSTTSVIAYSSIASWRDTNGDRLQEPGEPRGPFPLIARENLGLGTIILLSDPSVLINGMRGHMDNEVFAENLVADTCRDRTEVYFDESHRTFFDPISVTIEITGGISATAKALIAVTAFVLTLWIATDLVDDAALWIFRRTKTAVVSLMRILTGPFSREKPTPEKRVLSIEEMVEMVSKERPTMTLGLLRYMLRER